jgi:hypothetical protein
MADWSAVDVFTYPGGVDDFYENWESVTATGAQTLDFDADTYRVILMDPFAQRIDDRTFQEGFELGISRASWDTVQLSASTGSFTQFSVYVYRDTGNPYILFDAIEVDIVRNSDNTMGFFCYYHDDESDTSETDSTTLDHYEAVDINIEYLVDHWEISVRAGAEDPYIFNVNPPKSPESWRMKTVRMLTQCGTSADEVVGAAVTDRMYVEGVNSTPIIDTPVTYYTPAITGELNSSTTRFFGGRL